VNDPPAADDSKGEDAHADARTTALRVEATQIVASLAHGERRCLSIYMFFQCLINLSGSYDALGALLEFRAHQTLLYALAHLQPSDPPALCTALARAFRTLMSSIAEVVGPSDAGLLPERIACKPAAHAALDYLFEVITTDSFSSHILIDTCSRPSWTSISLSCDLRPPRSASGSHMPSAVASEAPRSGVPSWTGHR
jgi:hypothetical protein